MSYNPVVSVQIAINAVNLTQQGFGTPIFISAHQQADDRVIEVTSPEELVESYGFSTSSNTYIAVTQFFTPSPSPSVVMVGRRGAETQCLLSIPDGATDETFAVDVTYLNTDAVYSATYTTTAGVDDKEAVVDALKAQLDGISGFSDILVSSKVGTGDSANLIISAVDDDYTFQTVCTATSSGATTPFFTSTTVGTETAGDTYTNIKDYNQDFYFVTSEVRSHVERTFVEELADIIQADDKLYFISSNQQADIDDEDILTSFFYKAFYDKMTHVITFWHHEAYNFPECYYVGVNAPYDAGSVTWCNLVVTGLPPSSQLTNVSKPLTTSQLGKLIARNANFIQLDAGVNIIRTGITAGNEWIDVIRGVHWLTEELTVSLKTLLFNQKGKKIPFTNQGIAQVREVMSSALERAVSRDFLASFTISLPSIGEDGASYSDFVDRVLSKATFVGILAGAIHTISVEGEVTPPTSA